MIQPWTEVCFERPARGRKLIYSVFTRGEKKGKGVSEAEKVQGLMLSYQLVLGEPPESRRGTPEACLRGSSTSLQSWAGHKRGREKGEKRVRGF